MNQELNKAIEAVGANQYSFCKFITPNDAGKTGTHQYGLYVPKNSIKLLFDRPGERGKNKEKIATIEWWDGTSSECRFIYYGQGSRNEYRITRLGKQFEVGDFVVIVKKDENLYLGFKFDKKNDIITFLNTFNLTEEDTNSLIKFEDQFIETGDFVFKPRARIIKVIGQELISNDVIALVELIKNSYDADSIEVDIELNDILSDSGEIIVKDNGLGMSFEKIINVWLEPATPDKKNELEIKYSPCFKRRLLGEKGIGRFAAHRLGNNIELITRAKNTCNSVPLDYETIVQIDWTLFTEEKYLDEIPITVKKRKPIVFPENSGTLIKITNIQAWKNFSTVRDAVIKIKGLESPIKPKKLRYHEEEINSEPGISINISSDDIEIDTDLRKIKSLSELLNSAFYKFSGIISEDGHILYDYSFDRIDYQDLKRNPISLVDNLINYNVDWFEEHPLTNKNTPGEFEITFYAWDLDTAALKVAGLADYYRNIIKPNSGIRIYRDNFRVWPYGEQDNDWLELDSTRLNAPKERTVSRNQVFGVVHISSVNNSKLIDQSNREGLIVNEYYNQFYRLVNSALILFAKERKADKIKIDKVTIKKKAFDEVSESIDLLRNQVQTNQHINLYNKTIDTIEDAYQNKINDILERYMMAAAIGISYSIPIHEMKLRLSSIKHVLEDIERNASLEDKYLRELALQIDDTEAIIMAVSSIMSKQKRKKVNLFTVAKNVRILKEVELKKYSILYQITGNDDIEVEATPGLLNTAILNLVDNAIYWLRAKKLESRNSLLEFVPKITIEIGIDDNKKSYLKVIDNGPGFTDPFELLIEPYYSKKSDGFGLGLYLTNEIIMRNGGNFYGYNSDGATFKITF